MADWIAIVDAPLDVSAAAAFVTDPRAGGIDLFLGTTREEKHADGRNLIALDYEAYDQMAIKQMQELVSLARERWPIIKAAMVHRKGRVSIGEASIVIAVSTPHRAESFDACRFLIDQLKVNVPIWKKEVWSDQSTSWVEPKS